jgi:UDP-2,3-diacylglucosamine pyrophosphatase LpxH
MVGDRDWPLHLKGSQYDLIRHKIAHHLGLVTQYNKPFPHEAAECEQLAEALRQHRVLARHGDIFDPLSFGDDRDAASLSDVLAIELIARFMQHVDSELAGQVSPAAAAERTATAAVRNQIKRAWDYMVEQVLHLEIVRRIANVSPHNLIDGLAEALKFSRRDTHDWIGRTQAFLAGLRGAKTASYAQHALAEADCRNRRARHIVYGHTHRQEIVPLDASHADGYVLSQTYFNAGTWRRCYVPTQNIAGHHELVANDSFSVLTFYQADERTGRAHETWTGTLAPMTIDVAAGQSSPAAKATPSPIRAPQFAGATRAASMVRGY